MWLTLPNEISYHGDKDKEFYNRVSSGTGAVHFASETILIIFQVLSWIFIQSIQHFNVRTHCRVSCELNLSSFPPSHVKLIIGSPIMLIRDMYASEGPCYGTWGILQATRPHYLKLRIIRGSSDGSIHTILWISSTSKPGEFEWIVRREQISVRLCFSITIEKSKGQILKTIGASFLFPSCAHSQLYVALSRITDVDEVLMIWDKRKNKGKLKILYSRSFA